LTDLEFFEAVAQGKPVRFFIIEPHEPEPELRSLLTLVQTVVPQSFAGSGSAARVIELVKWEIQSYSRTRFPRPTWLQRRLHRYIQGLMPLRSPVICGLEGLRVLPASANVDARLKPDRNKLGAALDAAHGLTSVPAKQAVLSTIFSQLSAAPYLMRDCSEYLALWDRWCDAWLKLTAWKGHHNLCHMGRLAALNSLAAIRCLQATRGDKDRLADVSLPPVGKIGSAETWTSAFQLGGALASEHYSLAKLRWRTEQRVRILRKAMEWLVVADRCKGLLSHPDEESFLAGLAAIRGHIHLLLRDQTLDPVAAFEESLRLRKASGAEGSAIAEAKADLGYALARAGLRQQGLQLLEAGVAGLDAAQAEGFAAKSKLKLAELYLRQMRARDAIQQIGESDAICKLHGLQPRTASGYVANFILGAFRWLGRVQGDVRVRRGPSGYTYER
jgi:hypothetical protein